MNCHESTQHLRVLIYDTTFYMINRIKPEQLSQVDDKSLISTNTLLMKVK